MLSYFKSQQPTTIVGFILLFIVLKIPFLLMPAVHIAEVQHFWGSAGILKQAGLANILIAQLCIFWQALAFGYLFHKANFHEGGNLVPAVYFVLVTSLLPQFNVFSIYTLITFLLLAMFQVLLLITIRESAKLECFNLGLIAGLLIILSGHFLLFAPFLFIVLYVIKPFRFNEYLMLFFGIIFPVYVALSISYLVNWSVNAGSFMHFSFFRFQRDVLNIITLILAVAYMLFSFISLRGIMYSTGFKRRKNINMLVFFFIGMIATVLFAGDLDEAALSWLFVPMSIFLTLFMLRIRKKRLGEILNAIFVITVLVVNIVRILK